MVIENKEPRSIRPTHPGEMLREDFLPDYGLTTAGLAEAWACRGRRSMRSFGKSGPSAR